MNNIFVSTETFDFQVGEEVCPPDSNWNRRLKWNNGSCTDRNGIVNRYIERINPSGEVIYFRCNQFGVYLRTLMSEAIRLPFGDEEIGGALKTRVIVRGREVGIYDGAAPNRLIAYNIQYAPSNDESTLYDHLVSANAGTMKLEVSPRGPGPGYMKFDLRGVKRALEWCTDLPTQPLE